MEQDKNYQARKYVVELLRSNRGDEELLSLRNELDEKLIPELQAAFAEGRDYEDLSGDKLVTCLGWCLFNLERYEEVIAFVAGKEVSADREESFYELQSWTLFRLKGMRRRCPFTESILRRSCPAAARRM